MERYKRLCELRPEAEEVVEVLEEVEVGEEEVQLRRGGAITTMTIMMMEATVTMADPQVEAEQCEVEERRRHGRREVLLREVGLLRGQEVRQPVPCPLGDHAHRTMVSASSTHG